MVKRWLIALYAFSTLYIIFPFEWGNIVGMDVILSEVPIFSSFSLRNILGFGIMFLWLIACFMVVTVVVYLDSDPWYKSTNEQVLVEVINVTFVSAIGSHLIGWTVLYAFSLKKYIVPFSTINFLLGFDVLYGTIIIVFILLKLLNCLCFKEAYLLNWFFPRIAEKGVHNIS